VLLRVALVASWLNQYGGAERVLEAIHAIWPDAPVFTSIYDPGVFPAAWHNWDIRPTWMNRLPAVSRLSRQYLPLYPLAFESLRLKGFDLVLSVSSGFAHGARAVGAPHVSYCLTPPRFLWGLQSYVERERLKPWQLALLRPALPLLRAWDRRAAAHVDEFVAISHEVQRRIAAVYQRQAPIIYPPVDTSRFRVRPGAGDYFLVVSRLVPYRRIDLAVRACTRLGLPLKVVGRGRAMAELQALAGPSVEFLGFRPDAEVTELIEGCRALLWPGLEDFGITPIEALAAGRPVVAYAGGGALEVLADGETGVLFPEQTVESLCAAINRLDGLAFSRQRLRDIALHFDTTVFQEQLLEYVQGILGNPQPQTALDPLPAQGAAPAGSAAGALQHPQE
jgi:glycosyltransferase involved in cell wall biosynthesis